MNILWLAAYSPWPPVAGGKIRAHNLINRMLQLGHQVQVWCIDGQPPKGPVPSLKGLSVRWFKARSTASVSRKAQAFMASLPVGAWKIRTSDVLGVINHLRASDFDVIVLEQADLGALLPELLLTGIPTVLDAQNVESWLSWQIATAAVGSPSRRLRRASDAVKYWRLERRLVRSVAAVVAVSEVDKKRLASRGSTCPVMVHPNGVDLDYFTWSDHTQALDDRLILTGFLDYAPNFEACVWLSQSIMPAVRKRFPTATMMIIGAASDKVLRMVRQLHDPLRGFSVLGPVADVRPYLRAADVFIIPLRAGSGTRLKALEALASGLPVVGTPIGVEGLGLVEQRLALVGSTVAELTEAVGVALRDGRCRSDLTKRGRSYVESRFDWREIGSAFEKTLIEVCNTSSRPRPTRPSWKNTIVRAES